MVVRPQALWGNAPLFLPLGFAQAAGDAGELGAGLLIVYRLRSRYGSGI